MYFWFLIAHGGGEVLFAYRTSFSGVMNVEAGFCSKVFTLTYYFRLGLSLHIWSGGSSVITCRLDVGVNLKHPLDILMGSFETDSKISSSLLLA